MERVVRCRTRGGQVMKSYLKFLACSCVVLYALSGVVHSQAEPKKLTVFEASRLFLYIPLYFAVDKGYFQREQLDVTIFTAGRRDLAMKAVITGDAFASLHDPIEAALARSRGADVKIIAPVVNAAANWLVADQDITDDVRTWQGKSIALATPPNTQDSMFKKELRERGWGEVDRTTYKLKNDDDPSHYLKILYGAFGTDLVLMMNGQANMALTIEPGASTLVLKNNKHVILDYPTLMPAGMLFSSINVLGDTIRQDPVTVQKFVTALTKAYRDAYNNPSELAAVAIKWFPNADPEVVQAATKNMIRAKAFSPNTMFTKAGYQQNTEYFAFGQPDSPALKVKWEDIADTSFAERASKELGK